MSISKLKRISDLFQEGRELVLDPESSPPLVVWVNKPNSFEVEEARRDALQARALRVEEMKNDAEALAFRQQMEGVDDEEVLEAAVQTTYNQDYVLAMDDVEAKDGWSERIDMIRRATAQAEDADRDLSKAAADATEEYLAEVQKALETRQTDRKRALSGMSRDELEDILFKDYCDRMAFQEFMAEKRITEVFYSLRDCNGIQDDQGRWNHAACDHGIRLLGARSEVRTLPEELLRRVSETLDLLEVDDRTAGNSDAPASSSEPSELPSEPVVSTPSIPEVTPLAAPTT